MEPFVGAAGINFDSTASFIAEITRIFGDPDKNAAAHELDKLKQGIRDFSRYYSDFIRPVNVLEFDDAAKRHFLEKGLSKGLLNGLQYQDTPDNENLDNYVGCLKRMDERIRIRRFKGQSKPQVSIPFRQAPALRAPSAVASGPSATTSTHPGSVDYTTNKERKLPQEERERRIRWGLCLYCGEDGHMARECPKKIAFSALSARHATAVTGTTVFTSPHTNFLSDAAQ